MRAIVTGGAGFIGSHLAERLGGEGNDVLVIDNFSSGTKHLKLLESRNIPVENVDIRQEKLTSVIEAFRPKTIYHLAAQPAVPVSVKDPVLDAKVNVVGLLRVLEAARLTGARVVFSSSGGTIYGEAEPPVDESAVGRPSSPYGITKRVAEDYLRFYRDAHGLEFVSLALANVYGPRQDPHGEAGVVAIFTPKLLSGEECVVYGDGKQTRDFVYVADVVDAFVRASEKGEGETINIGTGIETSILELYDLLCGICGVDRPPRHEAERAGDLRRSALNPTKAKQILRWGPSAPFEEGLRKTVDSFRI